MDGDGEHTDGRITTAFRFRAWWLRTFRGYHLESKHRLPKQSFFGEIYYNNHWVLCKREEDEENERNKLAFPSRKPNVSDSP